MDITAFMWVIWLALILVFGILELFSLQFLFLMLAAGSLVGLLSGLLGLTWWLQVVVGAAAALILLAVIRPPLLRRLRRGGDTTPTNMDAINRATGTVTRAIRAEVDGQVRLGNGEIWTARSDSPLQVGAKVRVTRVLGATRFKCHRMTRRAA